MIFGVADILFDAGFQELHLVRKVCQKLNRK